MSGAANTSATGGYLVPEPPTPDVLYDAPLEDACQAMIAGVTGLAGELVRPGFQARLPQPPFGADWIAFWPAVMDGIDHTFQRHVGTGHGHSILELTERVVVAVQIYGPRCRYLGGLLRDALQVEQNRETFRRASGLTFVESPGEVRYAPEIINQGAAVLPRADLELRFARRVARRYPVRNIAAAEGTIEGGAIPHTWRVNP